MGLNSHIPTASSLKSCVLKFTSELGNHDYRYPHLRESCVLVPLIIRNGKTLVLLTKRSKTLRTHPGAVVFPGGVKDPTDNNDIDTALREAEEEIGLKRENIDVIDVLPPLFVSPLTSVVPVIGIIKEEFTPNLCADEVDYIMYLPLETFKRDNCCREIWNICNTNVNIYFFRKVHNDENNIIYGLTSTICMALAAIVEHRTNTMPCLFAEHSEPVRIEKIFTDYYHFYAEQSKYQTTSKIDAMDLIISANKSKL